MIDFSQVIDIMLGNTPVEQIEDSIGNVLWSATPPVVTYNVTITSGGNGAISVNGVVGDYSDTVTSGTTLTIQGIANNDYIFSGWSDGNTTNPRTITVNSDLVLSAAFKEEPFYVENNINTDRYLNIRKYTANAPTVTVYYSTDAINWTLLGDTSTTAITTQIPRNSKLYLKSTTNAWGITSNSSDYNTITTNHSFGENCGVGGNILSLLYGDDYNNYTTIPNNSESTFYGLFNGANYNNVNSLKLPSNTTKNCYRMMFTSNRFRTAPNLPATTLAEGCYKDMFQNCSSLTTAPVMNATTVGKESCYEMFSGCTSLTTAPALPATTLAQGCYQGMFNTCSSLTTAPALPATTLADNCYQNMFNGCRALTTAPALPATTLVQNCYRGMFANCVALTTAPVMAATTMSGSNNCMIMFQYCTSLTTAPALNATTLGSGCYQQMFQGCTALTTAPALPATTLTQGCYSSMFRDCTSLVNAPASLPASGTLINNVYKTMFMGCTSLTTAPVIYGTVLSGYACCGEMFSGCTNLNDVTMYATNISGTNCLQNWLLNTAASGTFHNMACMTYPEGASGIPSGWTEVHTTGNTINVTITNTSNYSGATYQIDSGTIEPINETGSTTFTISTSATNLTVNRNGRGVTDILGVCGMTEESEWTAVIPVNKMSTNVSIDLMSLM